MNIEQPLVFGTLQSSSQAIYTARSPLSNIEIGTIWLENVSSGLRVFSLGIMKNGVTTNLLTAIPLMSGYKILVDKPIGLGLNDSIQGVADINGAINFSIFGKSI